MALLTLSVAMRVTPVAAQPPRAQAPVDLGDVLFGRPQGDDRAGAVPHLARFRADTGDSFVLEVGNTGPAFLKYDDSGEVWALSPTAGPRGDVIYKNDVGEAMLRATRLGGLTVFSRERPGGMAAVVEGGANDLHRLLVSGPIAIFQVMVQASARASQAAGRRVVFQAGCPHAKNGAPPRNDCPVEADLTPGTEGIFADAANLAAQAFSRVERSGKAGQDALAHYNLVAFLNGRPPGVRIIGQEVRITVTPDMGFAGRPSSQRISQALFRR